MFLSPRSSKITVTKKKERRKGRSEEKERKRTKKKAIVALLVFIIATLKLVFGQKTLSDVKGPLGDNVFKNPAKHIRQTRENEPEARIDFKGDVHV